MGLCGTKHIIKWAPEEDDGKTAWMEDYDGMMAEMIADDLSPDQWELDLAQENLMNPPFTKEGDLTGGPHKHQRIKMWSQYKQAVHAMKGDRSDGLLKTAAMTKLGSSPYLQMRAKQWMNKLKEQAQRASSMNRRASTQNDPNQPSKYLAAQSENSQVASEEPEE